MTPFARGAVVCGVLFTNGILAGAPRTPTTAKTGPEKAFDEKVKPYLRRYCLGCHNPSVKTGGVAVDTLTSYATIAGEAELWEKILRKVRTGEMPPTGTPRAPQATTNHLVDWLGHELDRLAETKPDPGRVVAHRLNRAEYNNAVRDVLAVDFRPADDFPADDSGYGFDNIADVLSLPPMLMEKYFNAAGRVSRIALGRVRYDPVLDRFFSPRNQPQSARISDTAPIASRGGMEKEHSFPVDADYLFRVRLRGSPDAKVPEIVDLRLDGQLLKRLEAKFSTNEEDEEQRRLELKIPVKAGRHRVQVTFLRDDSKNESPNVDVNPAGRVRRNQLSVDWLEVGGPFEVKGPGDTESRRRVLSCRPSTSVPEEACASQILGRLARLAWRRPITQTERTRLLGFYRMGRQDSGEFEGGVELGIKAILVSPNFLFRVERDAAGRKPGEAFAVADLDLASRLSFFLWSSVPDNALLTAAERGQLKNPAVLEAQVQRMLADSRSRALTSNFAGQWLHLRNLESIKPDPEKFKEFDDDLREAMTRETELFFEAILKEDRSVTEFLDAPFTFLNSRLAGFYGIPGVEGRQFRRVELSGGRRGGVLTMASVLAVTSYPTRTSPVIRGKWVLENLLGAPPPPPPPDVPPLQEAAIGHSVSMRQQLIAHQANPSCAACHSKMDPIGFALENYDAIGRFREKEGGFEIDASGQLPSGQSFRNAADLKRILRDDPREFVFCLTEKLLTYALGRGVERADKPVIRAIARDAERDNYRLSSIILGITRSAPFRMRRAPDLLTESPKTDSPKKETPRAAE